MGVYYYFHNKNKNFIENLQVINGYFCNFVKNFHLYDNSDKIEMFKKCIALNNWSESDVILAVPDYYEYDVFKFEDDKIEIDNTEKDRFFVNIEEK